MTMSRFHGAATCASTVVFLYSPFHMKFTTKEMPWLMTRPTAATHVRSKSSSMISDGNKPAPFACGPNMRIIVRWNDMNTPNMARCSGIQSSVNGPPTTTTLSTLYDATTAVSSQ